MNPTILISGDYNAFCEGWNGVGVYMCSGLYESPTFKLPIYIGSSIDLQKRIERGHIYPLNQGKHDHNDILQKSWNKYSETSGFVWWLLESCSPENTLILEQRYLDLMRPFVDEFGGFNIAHDTSNAMKGRKASAETKLKMSIRRKGMKPSANFLAAGAKANKGLKRSQATRQKMSISLKGKNIGRVQTISTIQKRIKALQKTYKIVNPNGDIITVTNMKEFCKCNNLLYGAMIGVMSGRRKSHHKWKAA